MVTGRCIACGKVLTTDTEKTHKCESTIKAISNPDLMKRFSDFDLRK